MSDGEINISIKASGETEAKKAIGNVNDELKKTTEGTNKATNATKAYTNVARLLDPAIASLVSKLKNLRDALGLIAKSPILAVVTALTAAVVALTKAFDAMAESASKATKAALAITEKSVNDFAQRTDARRARDETETNLRSIGANANTSEDVQAAIDELEKERERRERLLADTTAKRNEYTKAYDDAFAITRREGATDEEVAAARESMARLDAARKELRQTEFAETEALKVIAEQTESLKTKFAELAAAEEAAAEAAEEQALAERKAAAQQALADYDDWALARGKAKSLENLLENGSYEEASAAVSAALAEKMAALISTEKQAVKGAENGDDITDLIRNAKELTIEVDTLKDSLDRLNQTEERRVEAELAELDSSLKAVGKETVSAYIGSGGEDMATISAIVKAMNSSSDIYAKTTADATVRTADAVEELVQLNEAQLSVADTDYSYVILA